MRPLRMEPRMMITDLIVISYIGLTYTSGVFPCHTKDCFTEETFTEPFDTSPTGWTNTLRITDTLLDALRWGNIIFLYEDSTYELLQTLLETAGDTNYLRTVSIRKLAGELSGWETTSMLKDVHQNSFPALHFIVISNSTRILELLALVEEYDLQSNRTTDYRHYSSWLALCTDHCYPARQHSGLREMSNVALISPQAKDRPNDTPCGIYTLTSTPHGKVFRLIPDLDTVGKELLLDTLFPNKKLGLNNRTLRVSVMESPGMMNVKGGYSGYLKEILDAMAQQMNFSYIIGLPPDMRWGVKVNGTWDGLIGQLVRREVDLVVATVTIHHEREEEMDFLLPPTFTEIFDIIYRLQEDANNELMIFFEPFKPLVFIALLATFVGYFILAAILQYHESVICNTKQRKSAFPRNLSDMAFYLFGVMILRGVSTTSKTFAVRFLLFSWGLFSVVVSAIFCANLVALLAVHKQLPPFRSLAELVDQDEYKFGMESGDVREVIFKNTKTGYRKQAWDKIVEMNRSDPEVLHRDLEVHTRKMFSEKYAYFTSRRFGSEHVNKDCRVRLVGEDVMWHQYGIGVPQDYPLKDDLEKMLYRMADNGLLDIWYERWKVSHENKCEVDTKVRMLDLHDLQTAFYVLCCGIALAIGLLLFETFICRIRRTKRPSIVYQPPIK